MYDCFSNFLLYWNLDQCWQPEALFWLTTFSSILSQCLENRRKDLIKTSWMNEWLLTVKYPKTISGNHIKIHRRVVSQSIEAIRFFFFFLSLKLQKHYFHIVAQDMELKWVFIYLTLFFLMIIYYTKKVLDFLKNFI